MSAFVVQVPRVAVKPRRQVARKPRLTVKCAVGMTFTASDFEIQRQVGQQGYYEVTEWEYYERRDPTQPTRTMKTSKPAIRLYEGKIATGPLGNTRVMLKEFLEPAYEIGVREAEVYKKLLELDDRKQAPVAELLGSFQGDSTFEQPRFKMQWQRSFPRSGAPPKQGSPWLVFVWEGNSTAAGYASHEQTPVFTDRFFPQSAFNRRTLYLKRLMMKSLQALGRLHELGFVHRSLGPASILCSTLEEQDFTQLEVKLRDFGFGSSVSGLNDKELKKARDAGAVGPLQVAKYYYADDIYALGYAFMEIIFGSLSRTGPGPQTTQEAFKRLYEDVYNKQIAEVRTYFSADDAYADAVRFLDDEDFSGWNLLGLMLSSLQPKDHQSAPLASDLAKTSFLTGSN